MRYSQVVFKASGFDPDIAGSNPATSIIVSFGVIGNTPDSESGDDNASVGSIPARAIYL